LSKYDRKIEGSEMPPIYDIGKVNGIQREIDAMIRPHRDCVHPAVQDFITNLKRKSMNQKFKNTNLN